MFRTSIATRLAGSLRSPSTGRLIQASSRSFSSKVSSQEYVDNFLPVAAAAALFVACTAATLTTTSCENTPFAVSDDDMSDAPSLDDLPEFSLDDVGKNNGENGAPVWMTYGGMVYDVTQFVANHPGGHEKILQAAGNVRFHVSISSSIYP
jgi:cytochrome b involved in lipid metabolism